MKRSITRAAFPLAFAATAASSLWRVFDRPLVGMWASIVAIIAGFVLAVFTRAARPAKIGITVVVVVAASVAMALGAHGSLGDGFTAVVRGTSGLLSSRWPASPSGSAIALVGLLAALCGALTVNALATRLPGPAALAPGVVVVAASAFLGAPAGPPTAAYLGGLVLAGVGTLATASPRAGKLSRPTIATALLAGVLPLVTAVWLDSNRYDPRDRQLEVVQTLVEGVSPLTLADELRAEVPTRVLFKTSGEPVTRWRLASLERYDGRVWMPGSSLQRAKGRLVGRGEATKLGARTTNVTMSDLNSQFVPTPSGAVTELSLATRTTRDLSTFVAAEAVPPNATYKVAGTVENNPLTLDPAAVAAKAAATTMVNYEVSAPLRELAGRITAGSGSDAARASAIADYLRTKFERDDESPAGHSAALIESFLLRTKRGREEQFVASYALLANAVGLPVRIVVGFAVPNAASSITSDTAHAWPEVEFVNIGWLRLDPTPPQAGPPPGGVGPGGGTKKIDQAPPKPTPPAPVPPTDDKPLPAAAAKRSIPVVGTVSVLVLLAPIAWLVAVLVRKRRRRTRRIAGDPRERIIGAFDEVADLFLDRGVPVRPSATDRELVGVGARSAHEHDLLKPLASLSTEAVYSDHEFDDERAEQAVAILHEFELGERTRKVRYARTRLNSKSLRRGRDRDPRRRSRSIRSTLSPLRPRRER
jgi:transglutaminase-like putative cysteine protease